MFLMALVSMTLAAKRIEKIDLSGEWDFGYGETKVYDDVINLPGSMLTNGKGREVDADTKWTGSLYDLSYYHRDDMATYRQKGNIKFPFFLTPDKEYVGNAFYRRYVDVPEDWKGRRVELLLERPHIETCLYVNGDSVGHDMSLSTPHLYDVTKYLQYGKRNEIELKVYNGIENVCVGQDSHSVTDQTQGNWNGVASPPWVSSARAALPHWKARSNTKITDGVSMRNTRITSPAWKSRGVSSNIQPKPSTATAKAAVMVPSSVHRFQSRGREM